MNYKNLFKQMSLALFMVLGIAACSKEESAFFESINRSYNDSLVPTNQFVYNMHLDCAPPDFEGKTTRANTDWANNSTIYLKFGSSAYGTAVYNKSTGVWTVTSSSLSITSTNQSCTAYYFEGAGTANSSNVELKETTAIYMGTGTYSHPTADDIYVSANLSPLTWRLCFKERSVTLNGTKSDIKYYSSFNPSNHNMSQSQMKDINLSNGQYVYGFFTHSGTSENTINVTTDDTYKRTIKGNQLSVKESGVLTAPSSSNYGTLGWTIDKTYTFDVQPTNISFGASAESRTISVTGNDKWTATSSASWCTLSKTSGTGATTLSVTVTQNTSSSARTASITFKGQNTGKNITISISQVGKENDIIYREPYTSWGATKPQTKSYMSSYTLYQEDDDALYYIGNNKETLVAYMFTESKLYSAAVIVNTSKTTLSEIDQQLRKNGYTYVSDKLYASTDQKTIVMIEENTSSEAFFIYYYDINYINSQNDTYFEEPYITWGASKSTVKTNMSNRGYSILQESSQATDNYYIVYYGKYKELYSMYLFNSSIKLSQVGIIFNASDASVNDLRNYLTSSLGYTYKGTNSAKTQFFHLSADGLSYAIVESGSSNDGTEMTYVTFVSFDTVSSGSRQNTRGGNDTFETIDTHLLDNINTHDIKEAKKWRAVRLIKNGQFDFPTITLP